MTYVGYEFGNPSIGAIVDLKPKDLPALEHIERLLSSNPTVPLFLTFE